MIPQLSLHSPEMIGVTHRSMWLPSVVCGLGLASVGLKAKRWSQGWPHRGLAGRGAVELGRWKGLHHRPTPGGFARREEAEAPQALLGCSQAGRVHSGALAVDTGRCPGPVVQVGKAQVKL